MLIICEEEDVFSENKAAAFDQLHKLFIRAAEGQHTLYISNPEHVLNSDFFDRGVAPMHREEWRELVERAAYAPDREDWTIDSETIIEKIHARLSSTEHETNNYCRWCILPDEAGDWAEMPLKVLMENNRDWSVIQGSVRVYNKQRIKDALERRWLEPFGCGGKDEIIPFINLQPRKARLAVFMDSDKNSLSDQIGDTQEKVKNRCNEKKIPCHILDKRTIENYIPDQVFTEISQRAGRIQKEKIEQWILFSEEQKNYDNCKKHFKSRSAKTILPKAVLAMKDSLNFTVADLEDRVGKELFDMLECLENFL
jgi:hypothetical protein